MRQTVSTSTLEAVDVECTHCGIRMTSQLGSGRQVRYFHCPSCQRWTTSVYTEVFRGDTKIRTRAREAQACSGTVKERVEQWLRSLGPQDPFHALGVSPMDSDQSIRERYRELARRYHPDRGGNAEEMKRINDAYERVLSHRAERRTQALGVGRAAMATT